MSDDRAQRNFTDAESRIMAAPGGRHFLQAYPTLRRIRRSGVSDAGGSGGGGSRHQVIVASPATHLPSDKQRAVAMIAETNDNTGAVPKEVSADTVYYFAQVIEDLHNLGVDPFIASDQTHHGRALPPALEDAFPNSSR